MFDPKKLMEMMKGAFQMQEEMQAALKEKRATGESGGGLVRATMNGHFELVELTIDESIVDKGDVTFLTDMVKGAVNDASRNAREMMKSHMASLTSKMGLPFPPKG